MQCSVGVAVGRLPMPRARVGLECWQWGVSRYAFRLRSLGCIRQRLPLLAGSDLSALELEAMALDCRRDGKKRSLAHSLSQADPGTATVVTKMTVVEVLLTPPWSTQRLCW